MLNHTAASYPLFVAVMLGQITNDTTIDLALFIGAVGAAIALTWWTATDRGKITGRLDRMQDKIDAIDKKVQRICNGDTPYRKDKR